MTEPTAFHPQNEKVVEVVGKDAHLQIRLADIFMEAPVFMAALRGPQHVFELANPLYYQLVGHRDIIGKTAAEALPEVVSQGGIALLDRVYATGEPFVGKDVPILLQPKRDGEVEEHFLDFTCQPLRDGAGTVTGILAHGIDLTARKRIEQGREQLLREKDGLLEDQRILLFDQLRSLEEQQSRAEHEELLNLIGTAVRSSLKDEEILRAAVAALGEGLNTDRCFIVRFEQERGAGSVFPEWVRLDGVDQAKLEPFGSQTRKMSSFALSQDWMTLTGRTTVVPDLTLRSPEEAAVPLDLNLRALLRVPITTGHYTTALVVAMADKPRAWTQGEINLVSNVAALLRATLESAQIQQRERNIAQQLQEALMPPPASDLPGLRLASYYRPALAESEVGGDFFDVFTVTPGCTALVVADLSGKGLAAAQQVSTVRNMLRYAVYTGSHLAEAMTTLSKTIADHDLLTGFATLFVGVYDHAESTLTYVNCGQEPGLIWRAQNRSVEELDATGPVMGGFSEGIFTQETVRLATGDVLALFTDGLTEVGPNRRDMLDSEGVGEVLRLCCLTIENLPATERAPKFVASRLIAGIDAFARGGTRDDIALLIGVVT